ncbi:MAG: hypothetical protein M3372_04545, partial [Verrucomicrobiota bacterium]|nr:hypothetical protein [Verrucomicrobiota bacterium]
LYDPLLSTRPWCIIANKMDLATSAENLEAVRQRFPGVEVIAISAEKGQGIPDLKKHLADWLVETVDINNANRVEAEAAAAAD